MVSMVYKAYISLRADVVIADLSLLIGLHDLKKERLLVNYVDNKLEDVKRGYFIPITYKNGHTFKTCNPHETYSTRE